MKKRHLAFIFIALFLLFTGSEAFYVFNHPDILGAYAFKYAKSMSGKGKTDKAFWILESAAKIVSIKRNTDFPGRVKLPSGTLLREDISKLITGLPENSFERDGIYDLGRIYYDFSVLAYNDGNEELTPVFLKTAGSYNPDLSFWYVELSNYYLVKGEVENSKKTIETCLNRPAPKNHCNDYLINNIEENQFEPVGFLKDDVSRYFESGLR